MAGKGWRDAVGQIEIGKRGRKKELKIPKKTPGHDWKNFDKWYDINKNNGTTKQAFIIGYFSRNECTVFC